MRLTEWRGEHAAVVEHHENYIDKLAAYEDTGYSPIEIKSLEGEWKAMRSVVDSYRTAEEQGLLVRLPQKMVYVIGWGEGKNCDHICPASIDGVGCCSLCDNGELIVYEEECRQEHLPYLGKTVFLTREETEAAMKGGQDDV